jgi:hypothetical protein
VTYPSNWIRFRVDRVLDRCIPGAAGGPVGLCESRSHAVPRHSPITKPPQVASSRVVYDPDLIVRAGVS